MPRHYSGADRVAFYEQLDERLATLPGASSAALSDRVPLTGGLPPTPVAAAGRPIPPLSERGHATRHLVSPREIGLRMALGASSGAVMRMVLGHGRRLTLVGIALGIAGAMVVSRLMRQALFDVDPVEPIVYLALSIVVLLVAEVAAFIPARRATRIDPLAALRTD